MQAEQLSTSSKELEEANDKASGITENPQPKMESGCHATTTTTGSSGLGESGMDKQEETAESASKVSLPAAEVAEDHQEQKEADRLAVAQTDTSSGPAANQSDSQSSNALNFDHGLDKKVVEKLEEMYQSGKLSSHDLDERAMEALKEFPPEAALKVLKQFSESNLEHVSNKSAFLCGVMKTYRQRARCASDNLSMCKVCPQHHYGPYISLNSSISTHSCEGHVFKGPDEEKIKEILERTGYTLDVTTGQRRYGGPPPNWDGQPPCKGCEVFCGKIPRDMFESDLIPLFERCGTIWDMRLMMDPMTNMNRGYAFITFTTKEGAREAVRQLHGLEVRKGKSIAILQSLNNHRLFVGNIPKNRDRDELFEEFSKHSQDLKEVIIYSSPDSNKKNRGFCFLEYESHKAASLAKRRLENRRVKVWNCDIIIDWADPLEEPDDETMSQVKVLYVRNLTSSVSEDQLRDIFVSHGHIERVKKLKDYAFVHFETRAQALEAMEALNNSVISGKTIEVSLAKPPSDKKKKEDVLKKRELRMQKIMATFPPMSQSMLPLVGPMYRTPRMPRSVLDMTNGCGNMMGGSMRANQGSAHRSLENGYQWPNMCPGVSMWQTNRHNTLTGYVSAHDQWAAHRNSTPISTNGYVASISATPNDLRGASPLGYSSHGANGQKTHRKK